MTESLEELYMVYIEKLKKELNMYKDIVDNINKYIVKNNFECINNKGIVKVCYYNDILNIIESRLKDGV